MVADRGTERMSIRYFTDESGVNISEGLNAKLNELVEEATSGKHKLWRGNFRVAVTPPRGLQFFAQRTEAPLFERTSDEQLIVVPTPSFVRGTNQKWFICLKSELFDLGEEWVAELIKIN